MKLLCSTDTQTLPNLPVIEQLVDRWNPPAIEGELEVSTDGAESEAICFEFRGVVGGRRSVLAGWVMDRGLLRERLQVPMLERVLRKFFVCIEGAAAEKAAA